MLLRFTPKKDHLKMVALTPVEGVVMEKTLVQLLPGVNEVTENEWKCMRPTIQKELDRGEITILAQKVSDGRGKPGGRKAKDLVQMPVNIAVNFIVDCTNPETLEKWYLEETREEVRIHIVKKLEKLGLPIPEDKIPEAPNGSPMSLDEYDADEEEVEDSKDSKADEEELDDALDFSNLSKNELVEKAKELGIDPTGKNKNELLDAIQSV